MILSASFVFNSVIRAKASNVLFHSSHRGSEKFNFSGGWN